MKIRFIQGMLTYTFFSFFVLSIFGIHGDIFMSIYSFLMGIEVGLVIYDYLVYKNVFKRVGKSIKKFFVKLKDKKNLRLMMCCIFVLTLFTGVKSVSAETTIPDNVEISNSCSINLYKPTTDTTYTTITYDYSNNNFIEFDSSSNARYSNILIPVKPNTSYYMNVPTGGRGLIFVYVLGEDFKRIGSQLSFNLYNGGSITTPDNAKYLLFFQNSGYETNISKATNVMLFEGTESTDYVAYEECSTPEPKPDPDPDTPGDSTTIVEIDYTIFCAIAVIIGIIFIYNFLKPMFYRKG